MSGTEMIITRIKERILGVKTQGAGEERMWNVRKKKKELSKYYNVHVYKYKTNINSIGVNKTKQITIWKWIRQHQPDKRTKYLS